MVVLRDGILFFLFVLFVCFKGGLLVTESQQFYSIFTLLLKIKTISIDNRISFSLESDKIFFQALHFVNILNRFVWCSWLLLAESLF